MNVIFLDFDGVLHGAHDYLDNEEKLIHKRINVLAEIVKELNCKVVIEAAAKEGIDEITLKTNVTWIQEYLEIFKSNKR